MEYIIEVTRPLYYETSIIPSEQDFLRQISNVPVLYLVLYWLKKEHLYPQFVKEEMDLTAVGLMREEDFKYFHLEKCKQFQTWAWGLGPMCRERVPPLPGRDGCSTLSKNVQKIEPQVPKIKAQVLKKMRRAPPKGPKPLQVQDASSLMFCWPQL